MLSSPLLRQALSGMRLHNLALSKTGRNQCFLNPFGSSTGRNQPSNKQYLWGMPKWLRGLAKPPEGCGIAYLDYGGQEFGVAAALSRDPNMMAAYRTGEAYLWFAKKGDLVPQDATRKTHGAERTLYKSAALAIQYTIGDEGLALHINKPVLFARHLIKLHHELFPQYWRWSDRMVNHAMLVGWQSTVFDWIYRLHPDPRPTTLRNFPVQSNGAEMLRLGHCLATERGITVDATAHDAYLISAPLDRLEADIALMRQCMAEASRVVLNGFELFVDVKEIRFPDRYSSSEGEAMWNLMMQLLEEVETAAVSKRNDQHAGRVL
jgi:DNA polymerase family A